MKSWWVFILVTVISLVLTAIIRWYALAQNLIDIPNQRSSHVMATPRGGGVAIVFTFLIALLLLLGQNNLLSTETLMALLGAGGWVAFIGFFDDHRHIPASWRLIAHFIGAGWALVCMGGFPPLPMFGILVDMGWLGDVLAIFYLVWLLNLYNFMDGIDGIAGIEAVTVSLGGATLYILSPINSSDWMLPMLLMAAVTGFLFWNFPKAKIFMGDVGSGFIGIVLGILTIHASWVSSELFWGWIILLGAFIVDSTITLVRRFIRGENIHEAHRSHAYQYAARRLGTHSLVAMSFGIVNILWLLPIALLVVRGWIDGVLGVMISYLPLILLAIYYRAGAKELQDI